MDIDIDFPPSLDRSKIFPQAIPATVIKGNKLSRHPCGVYFQNIPVDPVSGQSAMPYNVAADYGYFKIDFLNLQLLENFNNKKEIRTLAKTPPDWTLLEDPQNVEQLFQLHKHYDIVSAVRPTSIQELADCIAIIRPGKRRLLEQYLKDPEGTRHKLYRQEVDDKSAFKRSHAIAYATTVVLQLHLIGAGVS